jgi:DNA-binding beta-propeller fold protein YncE
VGQAALDLLSDTVQAGPPSGGGFVLLDGSPGYPAANPKTDTLYVPIQCATSFCSPNTPGHLVDVINTASCNAMVSSSCQVVARATVGNSPLDAVLDEQTDTLYTANGSGSVSVVNGARCNARVASGCATPLATIKTGGFPVAAAIDPQTQTLYVAAPSGQVFVIGIAQCSALTTAGCGQPVKTIADSLDPDGIAVNASTHTVYAANAGPTGNGDTVSVINAATCNGSTGTGCSQTPPTVTVGTNPFWDVVDQASNTIYVANNANGFNEGSVSVINGATCNAQTTAGCGQTPPAVPTGIATGFVAVDSALHTVYATNAGDDTLSAINTQTCDGTVTSGCAARPPNLQATSLQGPGYNAFPGGLALIPQTGTAYVVTVGGRNIASVTSIGRCNATNTTGCRTEAPAVPQGEYLLSADPATNTLYAGNLSKPQIDVINAATCHTRQLTGCTPVAEIPMPDPQANVGAIDEATHTLYAGNESTSGTVAVINTATCNATDTSGCSQAPPMIKVGAYPGPPVLNPATKTVYVPYGTEANQVAVVNAATCNATDTSGCSQAPAVVKVGQGTAILAVSTATDTVYAPASGPGFSGDTVALINGATCNGTDHTGCGHLAATATVGLGPYGAVVNDRTHTLYVANNADGDSPGTVSVINTATCNATDTTGCGGPFPTAATGNSPLLIGADTRTGTLYVTDYSSASVTILTESRCNAQITSGCRNASREQAVGSGPLGLAVNPSTGTVYVANQYLPGSMSILQAW